MPVLVYNGVGVQIIIDQMIKVFEIFLFTEIKVKICRDSLCIQLIMHNFKLYLLSTDVYI